MLGPLIETHCHLDYLQERPLAATLDLAHANGVTHLITIGVSLENQQVVSDLAAQNPTVFASVGMHPHHAKDFSPIVAAQLAALARANKKIVAIGEIGLDYHYNKSPTAIQRAVFEQQLALAADLCLPVIVHSREAEADTWAIIANFHPPKLLLHSFSSRAILAEQALSENYFLGFNGMITFKKSENIRQVVAKTPIDNIMLETDAPFLAPVPYRGKENAPHYLPLVAQALLEVKNLPGEKLKIIYQNTQRFFGLPAFTPTC